MLSLSCHLSLWQAKQQVLRIIEQLEASNHYPRPLSAGPGSGIEPLLLGEWRLVFASNGTVSGRVTGQ